MSLHIQCPHCRVNHPVPQLPPAGTGLRCNNCGQGFVTQHGPPAPSGPAKGFPQPQQAAAGFPQPTVPQAFQQSPLAPYQQQQRPAAPLPQRPVMPQRSFAPRQSSGGGFDWRIGLGLGILVFVIFGVVMGGIVALSWKPKSSLPIADANRTPSFPSFTPPSPNPQFPTQVTPSPTPGTNPFSNTPNSSGTSPNRTPLSATTNDPAMERRIRSLSSVQSKQDVLYNWQSGEKYRYGFEIKTEGGDGGPGGKVGVVEYEVARALSDDGDGKQGATGTAFVVHSQGLLMTCHHVVAGATSLKVHVNNDIYTADVVAIDKPNDLAIIRIAAKDLTPLPLGDSDLVQLAEDVKAVGYPLSDVLGRSVKITTGTIAGKVNEGARKLLQVDIAINPGNSGGPLVNSRGEVVGINSSGLFGSRIQEVSFSVPSNLAKDLLRTIDITSDASNQTSELGGVQLARKVTPSTAFVEVELGAESAAMLEFTGTSRSIGSSTSAPQQITSRMAASLSGDFLGSQEDLPLGFGLGTFGSMVIEKLPPDGEKRWEETNLIPVEAGAAVGLKLEERVSYSLESIDATRIVIEKRITCRTVGQSGTASVRVTGDGKWVFDRQQGVPVSLDMKFNSFISLGGRATTSRSTVHYERLSSSNPSPWQADLEKAIASASGSSSANDDTGLPKLPEMRPLVLEDVTDAQIATVARNLRGKKRSYRDYIEPLEFLGRVKPVEKKREEISALLHNIRTTIPTYNMDSWIGAVRVWGTVKNVPTLLIIIDADNTSTNVKASAIEALGRLPPTREGAEICVRAVPHYSLGLGAVQTLSTMGKIAEEPVQQLLDESEPEKRMIGSVLLAHLGTEKSVPVLENYLRAESHERASAIGNSALKQLRRKAEKGSKKEASKKAP